MQDLSTSKAAIRLSPGDMDKDFSIDSQCQTLITPPSEPDHMSPVRKQHESGQNQSCIFGVTMISRGS